MQVRITSKIAAAICLVVAVLFSAKHLDAKDDILTTAARNGSFNTLVSLVVAADLDDALQSKGHFTVFAPTDAAFELLPQETIDALLKTKNRDQLKEILTYHVIDRSITVPKHAPSHPLKSSKTLSGKRIRFERDGENVKVNDSNIVIRNIKCTNGIIQVIDAVLLPPEDKSIVSVAKKAGTFNTLLAAAKAAGLADTLASDGPFTVFAPTDEAFENLPKGTVKSLLKPKNKSKLAAILKYHVVKGKVSSRDAIAAQTAKTLNGSKVKISIQNGKLSINDSTVVANDVEAENGIIHVIDQVLIP